MHNSYFILYLFYSSGYLSPIRSALIKSSFSDKDILSIGTKILLAKLEEIGRQPKILLILFLHIISEDKFHFIANRALVRRYILPLCIFHNRYIIKASNIYGSCDSKKNKTNSKKKRVIHYHICYSSCPKG